MKLDLNTLNEEESIAFAKIASIMGENDLYNSLLAVGYTRDEMDADLFWAESDKYTFCVNIFTQKSSVFKPWNPDNATSHDSDGDSWSVEFSWGKAQ